MNSPPGNVLISLLGACVVVMAVSAALRMARGKPLGQPRPCKAVFIESWRPGRSGRGIFRLVAEIPPCLWVLVTAAEIRVGPHFPLSLLFLPELLHLDFRVPAHRVLAVEEVTPPGSVAVRFRHATGEEDVLVVRPRNTTAFRDALREMRTQ